MEIKLRFIHSNLDLNPFPGMARRVDSASRKDFQVYSCARCARNTAEHNKSRQNGAQFHKTQQNTTKYCKTHWNTIKHDQTSQSPVKSWKHLGINKNLQRQTFVKPEGFQYRKCDTNIKKHWKFNDEPAEQKILSFTMSYRLFHEFRDSFWYNQPI